MSNIILPSELRSRSLCELWGIHANIERELLQSEPCSAERRNALANLENILRIINEREASPLP